MRSGDTGISVDILPPVDACKVDILLSNRRAGVRRSARGNYEASGPGDWAVSRSASDELKLTRPAHPRGKRSANRFGSWVGLDSIADKF